MRYYGRADSVEVDSDEDGFHLIVETEDGDYLNLRIQHLAWDLAEHVDQTIGAWRREGEAARDSRPIDGQITVEDLEGYDLDDPKRITLQEQLDRQEAR